MKRRQGTVTTQNERRHMKTKTDCYLCASVRNETEFIPIFGTDGKTEQLYEKIMNYTPFKRDTKHRITDISYSGGSSESTQQKKKTPCNIRDEFIVPDKVMKTASDCQNVECSSNAEIYIHKRSKQSASLVTNTCFKNSNKRNFIKNTVNAPSSTVRICSGSRTAGTYCIARWCGNNAKKSPGISLFRIPKDPDRALLWLTNAEREDLKLLSMEILHTKYLCMEHFNDDMFMNSCKKKLVWNALPTHFPKPDYAHRKKCKINSHLQQQKINVPETRHIILSAVHHCKRRRPLKPKPLTAEPNAQAGSKSRPGLCNSEETKSLSVTVSAVSSLADSSQCIKNEESTLTEIRTSTLKMKINDTYVVPKCQITSQLSLQSSKMLAIPDTSRLVAKCQEPTGHTRTANIILCSNLNEIIGLKQDKIQTVTSTCEYLSLGSTDYVDHKDNHIDTSTVGGDRKNESDTLMSDESYLNCDTESLCLDHAFRETNERIYPCRYCGEMFLVKSNLILHQTTYHSDHPVGCELCGKVLYKSRSEFMEHVCDHHSDNKNSYVP